MGKPSAVAIHFDRIAKDYDSYTKKRSLHYARLKELLANLIPPGKKVFEVGCGTGDLLASLKPRLGFGTDISSKMISLANRKYQSRKNLTFSAGWPKGKFDYIFMSDVIEHLENPEEIFGKIARLMDENTVFINTMMNLRWIPVELVYNLFGWKMPEGPHRRVGYKTIKKLVENSGMKITRHDYALLMPIKIPLLTDFLNRHMEKYLKPLSFIEFFVAKKIRNS